jgi:hypothetical protein
MGFNPRFTHNTLNKSTYGSWGIYADCSQNQKYSIQYLWIYAIKLFLTKITEGTVNCATLVQVKPI